MGGAIIHCHRIQDKPKRLGVRRSPRWLAAVAACAVLGCAPRGVLAHAVIIASQPAANAILPVGDFAIRLQFNSRIDAARSRLTLVAPAGSEASLAAAAGDAPGVLVARAHAGSAGRWTLRWQVLSLDGHVARGEVPFRVQP
jgi:methionine-rich copper-binding protein CopC